MLLLGDSNTIEFLDAVSLAHLGFVHTGREIESITVRPDGRMLYLALGKGMTDDWHGLSALDLENHSLCLAVQSASFGLPSPDGRLLFTQLSSGAVDVFDARTFEKQTAFKAFGVYNLLPSPDGRALFGIRNLPEPNLDVFDVEGRKLVARIRIPSGPAMGVWIDRAFYLFSYGEGGGHLWRLASNSTSLPAPQAVHLPDLHGDCNQPVLLTMAGAADRLFIAEVFGLSVDRRRTCTDHPPGGVFVIDRSSGRMQYRLGEGFHINRMAVSDDGNQLYVIDSPAPNDPHAIRLFRMDAWTGRIMGEHDLHLGSYSLALAHVPAGLVRHVGFSVPECKH